MPEDLQYQSNDDRILQLRIIRRNKRQRLIYTSLIALVALMILGLIVVGFLGLASAIHQLRIGG